MANYITTKERIRKEVGEAVFSAAEIRRIIRYYEGHVNPRTIHERLQHVAIPTDHTNMRGAMTRLYKESDVRQLLDTFSREKKLPVFVLAHEGLEKLLSLPTSGIRTRKQKEGNFDGSFENTVRSYEDD
ncbi:MAG: hypothetical protein Q7R96_06190 [Nanoarchaeota archaeon]|nr:hypothetical protein [Nanoarchaeota archaeon]